MNKQSELINLAIKHDLKSLLNHFSTEFYLMINNRLGKSSTCIHDLLFKYKPIFYYVPGCGFKIYEGKLFNFL